MSTKSELALAEIGEVQKLIQRHAPIWCDGSALITVLRTTAVESGDFRPLISDAYKGCKYAHRALCEQAALHIGNREELPDNLREYAGEVLLGLNRRKGSKGEDGSRDIPRNFFIAYLVERTRLRGYDAKMASYIVSQAARDVKVKGLKMPDGSRVRQIWEEYGEGCDFDLERIRAEFETAKQRKMFHAASRETSHRST